MQNLKVSNHRNITKVHHHYTRPMLIVWGLTALSAQIGYIVPMLHVGKT